LLKRLLVELVTACSQRAALVVTAGAALTVLFGAFAATNLGMHTDTDPLFSNELPWRKLEWDYRRAFPQNDNLLAVVIDARSPARAQRAAVALEKKLGERPELFRSVRRPDADGYLVNHGLLYLDVDELRKLASQVAEVQPFLGTLAADPSLDSLFTVLAEAIDAVRNGDIDAARIAKPLEAVTDSMESVLAGGTEPLSWRTLVTGREPEADELRRFLLVQPALDYGSLSAGAAAAGFIRESAAAIGLTPEQGIRVRLTGSVALSDEEFATVAEGTGLAAVVSFTLVSMLLLLAVRSVRLVLCILATLVAGVIATCAFAAAAVGAINIISIAFIVLFIGIAVDFGIQFSVRYLDEHARTPELREALRATAGTTGVSLTLAASACAVGFLSLVPTDYKGMAELGIISGAGMLIALVLNLTLLPALIVLLRPRRGLRHAGFAWAAPADAVVLTRRRPIIVAASLAAVAGVFAAPKLQFDFDPLNLKDPETESVATLYDLLGSPNATPFTISILEPSLAAAETLAERLRKLPEVDKAMTLKSFVPDDQETKLEIIDELALLTGPIAAAEFAPDPAADGQTIEVLRQSRDRIAAATIGPALEVTVARLLGALDQLLSRDPVPLRRLEDALLSDLPFELDGLDRALQSGAIVIDELPADLRHDWVTADGRARIEVFSSGDIRNNYVREVFAKTVRAIAPNAGGAVISSIESGRTIVGAFITAGLIAIAAITVLLAIVLRRVVDVLLVLAPLLLAGLVTLVICVAFGLPLNFANIIALPLILGIGVSFAIYFVINWRNGIAHPLQSATARAVSFSALLTGTAFGSLMLSSHPGTASMGELLSIALGCTLLCTLFVLPALHGPPAGGRRRN
jgi:hopanoid biosynthesis associated RND transporter like protein HpnN